MKRQLIKQRYPHILKLPKDSRSPSGSIYRRFDIAQQTKAVLTFSSNPTIVRCQEPFILSVQVGKKIKRLVSKKEK